MAKKSRPGVQIEVLAHRAPRRKSQGDRRGVGKQHGHLSRHSGSRAAQSQVRRIERATNHDGFSLRHRGGFGHLLSAHDAGTRATERTLGVQVKKTRERIKSRSYAFFYQEGNGKRSPYDFIRSSGMWKITRDGNCETTF